MTLEELRALAAKARAEGIGQQQQRTLPDGERQRGGPEQPRFAFETEYRAELVERDGREFYMVEGYASMVEKSYEMWDMFGPYDEVVSKTAFDKTLAAKPEVVFRFNHGGMAMASTTNGRLELWADSMGLGDRAWINPKRSDVAQLVTGIEDRDVGEQSFMFMITEGGWNEDYTEFRIDEVDLDRGDVGPVTYGANPHTLIAARAGDFLNSIPDLSPLVAREALTRLTARADIKASAPALVVPDDTSGGQSIRLALAQLEVDRLHS